MTKEASKETAAPKIILPNRIKEMRLSYDYYVNQDVLAEILGISVNSLSRYENGIREVPTFVLARAAFYFHVSIDYLLYRTDCKDPSPYDVPPYGIPTEILQVAENKQKKKK